MSVNPENSIYAPTHRTAYGRIIREKGTLRILVAVAVLVAAWFIYDAIHTSLMNQVKWPTLKPATTGLTVLGLRDKDKPGFQHHFEARESNHSWQIRYNEEYNGPAHSNEDEDSSETRDRGSSNPGASHHGNSGATVLIEDVMKECPTVMTGANFTGASIQEDYESFLQRSSYTVHVDLNEEGRSRYWQFSRDHAGERLVFVLNNEVLTCPIMVHMYVGTLSIGPIWVKEDAQKLVDFINGQKTK